MLSSIKSFSHQISATPCYVSHSRTESVSLVVKSTGVAGHHSWLSGNVSCLKVYPEFWKKIINLKWVLVSSKWPPVVITVQLYGNWFLFYLSRTKTPVVYSTACTVYAGLSVDDAAAQPPVLFQVDVWERDWIHVLCRWWQVPYYWAGIKAYDLVAGSQCVKPSYMLSKSSALEKFPMLKRDKLKAAIVYYDGNTILSMHIDIFESCFSADAWKSEDVPLKLFGEFATKRAWNCVFI